MNDRSKRYQNDSRTILFVHSPSIITGNLIIVHIYIRLFIKFNSNIIIDKINLASQEKQRLLAYSL